MNIRTTSSAAAVVLMIIAGTAHAALVKNGDGTTTDTSTNLIWLQNWDSLGAQSWDTQTAWADNLVFAGSSDWRLPSYDEYFDVSTGSAILAGGFFNVRREHFYWSTTEIADDRVLLIEPVTRDATAITTLNPNFKFHAVAVRPGDVVSPVPEPSTLALALLALGATALNVRRRRAQDSSASGFGASSTGEGYRGRLNRAAAWTGVVPALSTCRPVRRYRTRACRSRSRRRGPVAAQRHTGQQVKTFRDGRYEQLVQLPRPVRHVAHRFGGSHAQRDVIERTLIEAARRAGMTRLFEALGHERASAKAYPAHRAASAAGHLNFMGGQA